MSAYSESLKEPAWQKKRLEIFSRDEWKCRLCGASQRQLCVHHLCYAKYGHWSGVPDRFLITICSQCHEELHGFRVAVATKTKKPTNNSSPKEYWASEEEFEQMMLERFKEDEFFEFLRTKTRPHTKSVIANWIRRRTEPREVVDGVTRLPVIHYDSLFFDKFVERLIQSGKLVATAWNKKGKPWLFLPAPKQDQCVCENRYVGNAITPGTPVCEGCIYA